MQILTSGGSSGTLPEDYKIASKIAEHYGFKLNQPLPSNQFLNLSLSDAWNKYSYCTHTVHVSNLTFQKPLDRYYRFTGFGGEMIRGAWLAFKSFERWKSSLTRESRRQYSPSLYEELSNSLQTISESAFRYICSKYKIEDPTSLDILQYYYNEARGRHHVGKGVIVNYFANTIAITPILDPLLRSVKVNTPECPDHRLLMTLLFIRHAPDLLKFPFDSKRFIEPETIEYAKRINERFPRQVTTNKVNGGGITIYRRVICKSKKSSLRGRTIHPFLVI